MIKTLPQDGSELERFENWLRCLPPGARAFARAVFLFHHRGGAYPCASDFDPIPAQTLTLIRRDAREFAARIFERN